MNPTTKNLLKIDSSYNRDMLMRDVIAGLTIVVLLVPQAMAYAMLAGLPPVMGLYASTIPLIIYALFASSKHLAVGPTAITSLLVFSGVSAFAEAETSQYIAIALVLALMVGMIQLLMGVFKLGFIVQYISGAVINAYTSAAAFIIGLSQLGHLLGIELENHLQLHHLMYDVITSFGDLNVITAAIGMGSIISLILVKKYMPRIPSALFIVVVTIAVVFAFGFEAEGVDIVGAVPSGLPELGVPEITFDTVQMLIPTAFLVALMGFMESLAIGKTIADRENYTLDANQELKSLGLANMSSAFVQAYPVNASLSRSAINHQAGAVSQVASLVTAAFIILTLLFFTSYFYYLPQAALAAIIMVAISKLVDFRTLKYLWKVKRTDGINWLVTFFVTLFLGIQWGFFLGALFSFAIIINRSTKPNIVELGLLGQEGNFYDRNRFPEAKTFENTVIARVDASLHFANISMLKNAVNKMINDRQDVKFMVIDLAGVNDIDVGSIKVLKEMVESLAADRGITLYFTNMKGPVRDVVERAESEDGTIHSSMYRTIEQALEAHGVSERQ
ncbi:SulP family inorganic anion transporter [Texcoconibacillus texcoconensis]|uniref:SulP family sulfate permease n=1 Tax=Texcoconibacillus texcoconensis TaxID=1095777 RepID=A0A840QR73_9BACI|nr:sulfate permease [Texcoconibacillus texcoconensis]MBB5173823.1 SulP family sulfate permease [Texcoconibacillus texcoconensis]